MSFITFYLIIQGVAYPVLNIPTQTQPIPKCSQVESGLCYESEAK